MATFFISIYHIFQRHKTLLYGLIVSLSVLFAFMASRISLEEDILRFVPQTADTKNISAVFGHLKVKDKIIVIVYPESRQQERELSDETIDQLCETADTFAYRLNEAMGGTHINQITSNVINAQAASFPDFIYNHLPMMIDSADYVRIDSLLTPEAISRKLEEDAYALAMPTGIFTKDYILKDPLGIGNKALGRLAELRQEGNYNIKNEHLFTDNGDLLLFIHPRYPANKTTENAPLVDEIERLCKEMSNAQISLSLYGGPVVSVYNARQVRNDMMITMGIALLIITSVILLTFKNKMAIFFILLPVLFGGLFALAMLSIFRSELSIIAIGAGSAILGVLLSYSIHVVTHHEHEKNIDNLIADMWQPLTIGSFTTIGAFFSLVFTKSEVLQDFGWFASLSIIGATIFCLFFLPHLLELGEQSRQSDAAEASASSSWLMRKIDAFTSYDFSKHTWLSVCIFVLAIGGAYLSGRVGFSTDMNALGYNPPHLEKAQETLDNTFQKDSRSVYFIAVGENTNEALNGYQEMTKKLEGLKENGNICSFSSARCLLLSEEEQQKRLNVWNSFWTKEKCDKTEQLLLKYGPEYGFTPEIFANFLTSIKGKHHLINYDNEPALQDFLTNEQGLSMAIAQVNLTNAQKTDTYLSFSQQKNVVILDKPHFLSMFVDATTEDFNFVLLVSSLIVFIALLVSYGRFELALLSFMPMALSWFIILGIMAVLGLKFNIVSVIISTFIFGTGDDFSIFVTDGLLSEYRSGRKLLSEHKTAILFSAFTTIVGMGALFFAKHPSLLSVAQTSVIGMVAVVLIAFVVQPFLWRIFVTSRTDKGRTPWTITRVGALIGTLFFGILTILLALSLPIILLLPTTLSYKRKIVHWLTTHGSRLSLRVFNVKYDVENQSDYDFGKPTVVIANHQSIYDLLIMFAHTTKIVMVVKKSIWHNPVLGPINWLYGSCFVSEDEGYASIAQVLKKRVEEGFSPLIFPEGHRCDDSQELRHFHRGAFQLADELHLNIQPVILMGNADAIAKGDMFFRAPTRPKIVLLPQIEFDDKKWGETTKERNKSIANWYKEEYKKEQEKYIVPNNLNRRWLLCQNFIYKGPVTEWYTRVKTAMEKYYELFHRIVPRKAKIIDIGCGYGFLDYMLMFTSPEREILGLDYDSEKIAVANNCFSRKGKENRLSFKSTDAINSDMPKADVFIMLDMLHYMTFENQEKLIEKCMRSLLPGGFIIIRDGNTSNESGQKVTRLTEVFSTQILKFNKTEGNLHFTSKEKLQHIAQKNGFVLESIESDTYTNTSNEIVIMKKM